MLERARAAGVGGIVVSGYDLASSRAAVELAARHEDVWATVGIHPHDARFATPQALAEVERLARRPRVVAIGECGLDFYRDLSPRDVQARAFEAQLELAAALDLPVVVHSREAMPETLHTLARARLPAGGVLHCFDGDAEDARQAVSLGLYLSAAGPLTYRRDLTRPAPWPPSPWSAWWWRRTAPTSAPPATGGSATSRPTSSPWPGPRRGPRTNDRRTSPGPPRPTPPPSSAPRPCVPWSA